MGDGASVPASPVVAARLAGLGGGAGRPLGMGPALWPVPDDVAAAAGPAHAAGLTGNAELAATVGFGGPAGDGDDGWAALALAATLVVAPSDAARVVAAALGAGLGGLGGMLTDGPAVTAAAVVAAAAAAAAGVATAVGLAQLAAALGAGVGVVGAGTGAAPGDSGAAPGGLPCRAGRGSATNGDAAAGSGRPKAALTAAAVGRCARRPRRRPGPPHCPPTQHRLPSSKFVRPQHDPGRGRRRGRRHGTADRARRPDRAHSHPTHPRHGWPRPQLQRERDMTVVAGAGG